MQVNTEAKTKLMILTPTLECGGSEKFVSMVCEHINTGKYTVCLVVVNNSNPFFRISNPAVAVVDLKKERVLFSLAAIKKTVENFKPDIIFSTASHLNLYLAIFKKRFSHHIKFVAREASIVSINSAQAKMPVLYKWLIKKYYHRFDMIICQSAYMQHDLQAHFHLPENKTTVINNAAGEIFDSAKKPVDKKDHSMYKFVTIARLSEEKGIERLIHAIGLLSIPFKYYIIGNGNKRSRLQNLITALHLQDKVFLSGQKNDPFAGMEDADLFLLGSYYEGFPNVLLEAGARGIPVVAFNAPGGIAEIIKNNINGMLVKDNDLIGFASAIKEALAKNYDRNQIMASTKERFSVSNMMQAIERIFLKLTPNK